MSEFYSRDGISLHHGDCLVVMRTLPDCSVDSVVTDPPYGLKFMGKAWDHDVPGLDVWQECLRVLKPGGYLLAFAGTRTQHRMAVNIEDAGFEIRDMICWVYGSGFPKSLDVSKAIDKMAGAEREVVGERLSAYGSDTRTGERVSRPDGGAGYWSGADSKVVPLRGGPATDEAKKWDGWGTALKPALEPITVARKPLIGTVAANVLEHGTGAINVDACRVAIDESVDDPRLGGKGDWSSGKMAKNVYEGGYAGVRVGSSEKGRFPANLIHDGSDEVLGLFPQTASGKPGVMRKCVNSSAAYGSESRKSGTQMTGFGDSGSAARFFYCAKANKKERKGSKHPTVKPLALMRYLVRMVTRQGGTVLDPYAGTGTTIEAAAKEGCSAIGIEKSSESCQDSVNRLDQPNLL